MALRDLRSDRFAVAAWVGTTDGDLIEVLARSSFAAVVFDMQHGLHDTGSVARGIATVAAGGKPAIVRVPLGDLAFVSRALDLGASAIILPMIETAEDAKAFVSVAKYPPLGQRSFGPTRAVQIHGYDGAGSYVADANVKTLAIAMIETRAAYDDLDAILAVEGLDGVLVGPSDLSLALFGRLDPDGTETVEAAAAIVSRAKAAGKFASIYASGVEAARRGREQGFDLACLSFDAGALLSVASALVEEIDR